MIKKRLVTIYKQLIPNYFVNQISIYRNAGGLNTIRKGIFKYYRYSPEKINDEVKIVLDYLKWHPLTLFPYSFFKKYNPNNIIVFLDYETNMNYVLHNTNRLYFKRGMSISQVQDCYNALLIEQDIDSPHRYLTTEFKVDENDIVADVGSAEGVFALSIIHLAKHVYLFETDKEWIDALNYTFKPWINKVTIVNKYVSNKNNNNEVSLDNFTVDLNIRFDLVKIDVDGAELELLQGSDKILSNPIKPKIAICTYHKAEDELSFKLLLDKYGIRTESSKGYIIFIYDKSLSKPYLRKGLLRSI